MTNERRVWTENPVPHFGNSQIYVTTNSKELEEYERLKVKYGEESAA